MVLSCIPWENDRLLLFGGDGRSVGCNVPNTAEKKRNENAYDVCKRVSQPMGCIWLFALSVVVRVGYFRYGSWCSA